MLTRRPEAGSGMTNFGWGTAVGLLLFFLVLKKIIKGKPQRHGEGHVTRDRSVGFQVPSPNVSLLSEHRKLVSVSQHSIGQGSLGEWVAGRLPLFIFLPKREL